LVSQPLAALPSQFPKPLSQLDTAQLPELQVATAFVSAQALPQPPQCVVLFRRCSQPSAAVVLQSP
jgi:hypothetical protein